MKVEGCINQNFAQPEWGYDNIHHLTDHVTHTVHTDSVTNVPTLQFVQTLDKQETRDDLRYSRTYNCLPEGGELLTITGTNFGIWEGAVDSVLIGGIPCTDVKMTVSEQQVTCVTPPGLTLEVTSTTEWYNEPGMSYYDTTTGRPHGTTSYRGPHYCDTYGILQFTFNQIFHFISSTYPFIFVFVKHAVFSNIRRYATVRF